MRRRCVVARRNPRGSPAGTQPKHRHECGFSTGWHHRLTITKITSDVRLVSEVVHSGRFKVPWHQRYYDWKVEQVGELLSDLSDALDTGETCYFLGSIMLVEATDTKLQRINDGQQRLITLSLLIAAFCRRFARKRPRDRVRETLALRALFDRPDNQPSRLADASRYESRIEPPRNDKSKYIQILRGHDIGTNGLLTAAWNVIDIFVEGMGKPAREDFFDFIMQKVEISVLIVPGDVDANSVFEALNARGKPLDDVDLIRNRLYSYFSETEDATRRETVHGNLENTAIILRSPTALREYFRCFLQCHFGYLQKNRFYREARREIEKTASPLTASDYVFDLIARLGRSDCIELFRTITSSRPSENLEKRLPTVSGKRSLTTLLGELKGYSVSHPLVFSLLHRFITETDNSKKRKTGLAATHSLRNLASFVMRTAFVAPKFEPSRFDAAFANCAKTVFQGNDMDSMNVLQELKRNDEFGVIDDANFIRLMTEVELRDDRKAMRYLFGINARNQRGSDVLRQDRCSVEHVLPQSEMHWSDWIGFKDVNAADWVYRTGNLLVVSRRENRTGPEFNRNFVNKKRAFHDSPLLMPRTVAATYDDWTPDVVRQRSRQLAKEAATTWQLSRK